MANDRIPKSHPPDPAEDHVEPTVFQPDPLTAPSSGDAPGGPFAGTENAPQGPTANSPFGPANQPEDPLLALPQSLKNRYQLVSVLGKGGFANVYRAKDTVLDQDVAIKILKLGLTSKSDQDRFLFEARVSAKLRHTNIVTVYDIIRTPDGLQLIMEYYPHGTLSELIKKKGALRPRKAIDFGCQILKGLAHAHRRDIIHRDIKPANIFLAEDGVVKLGDFGIAANVMNHEHTQTGMIIGTPLYMAPEQAQDSRDVDPRTDIYAMGLMLYHMLTGHPPRVLDLEMLPEPFRRIIKQATEPDRMKRMVSAKQFIAMLEQVDAEFSGATPLHIPHAPHPGAREEATLRRGDSRFDHNEYDYEEESLVGETVLPMPETTQPPSGAESRESERRAATTTATDERADDATQSPPVPGSSTAPIILDANDSTATQPPPDASPAAAPDSLATQPQPTPARAKSFSRLAPILGALLFFGAAGAGAWFFFFAPDRPNPNANPNTNVLATLTPDPQATPEPSVSPTPAPTQSPAPSPEPTASPTPRPSATPTPTPSPREQMQAHIATLMKNSLIANLTRQIELYYKPGNDEGDRVIARQGLRSYLAQINNNNPQDPFVQLLLAYGQVALGQNDMAQQRIQSVLTTARRQRHPLPQRAPQIHELLGFSGNVPMLNIPSPERPLNRPRQPGFGSD